MYPTTISAALMCLAQGFFVAHHVTRQPILQDSVLVVLTFVKDYVGTFEYLSSFK